jgi:hypothetical protein
MIRRVSPKSWLRQYLVSSRAATSHRSAAAGDRHVVGHEWPEQRDDHAGPLAERRLFQLEVTWASVAVPA